MTSHPKDAKPAFHRDAHRGYNITPIRLSLAKGKDVVFPHENHEKREKIKSQLSVANNHNKRSQTGLLTEASLAASTVPERTIQTRDNWSYTDPYYQ